MVPAGGTLISIVYKYNASKVISFSVTDNSVITNTGLTYLYKYPDQFNNVYIFPVASLLVMYKFFGCVDEFQSHNKSRQSNLALG